MHHTPSRQRALLVLLPVALALVGVPRAFAEDLSTSSGAGLYRQFCASCHGKGGEGDGPVAPFFKLRPPDLTLIAKRSGGTFPAERVRRIVDGTTSLSPHGAREMPVWGLEFSTTASSPAEGKAVAETTIARLVEYLRSIQKAPAQ
jgi:mono/diheme cytochrome c family protein